MKFSRHNVEIFISRIMTPLKPNVNIRFLIWFVAIVLLVNTPQISLGQNTKPNPGGKQNNPSDDNKGANRRVAQEKDGNSNPSEVAERDKQNIDFVLKHHRELASLLDFLRQRQKVEFDTAMRDLAKVRLRLEMIERRDPELFELELAAWKIDSKIKLMLAQRVAQKESFDRTRLEALVQEQMKNQIERWQYEQARLARRAKLLQENLDRVQANPEVSLEQQVNQLLRKSDAKSSSSKRPPRSNTPE